jgi:hypothetical protein
MTSGHTSTSKRLIEKPDQIIRADLAAMIASAMAPMAARSSYGNVRALVCLKCKYAFLK